MDTETLNPDELAKLLEKHGILLTPQRMEIARLLFARRQHLSAEQILLTINADRHRVSKATVYNTLGLFVQKGLIREVIVDPSRVFYDPNTGEHHHIYNIDSGLLMDIDVQNVTVNQLPDLPPDMIVDGVDIIVRVRSVNPTAL